MHSREVRARRQSTIGGVAQVRQGFDEADENRPSVSLAGLAVILLIVVASLIIVRKLQVRCLIEHCLMAGQPGCEHSVDRLRVSLMFSGQ